MLGCFDEPGSGDADKWGGSLHDDLHWESDGVVWWEGDV